MKTIRLIAFAVALLASAFAGPLNDSANVFGPRGKDVSAAISSLPVTIETRVDSPTGGIKAYADAKAAEATRGFYVVITTQPREWRVSMNPVGLASSEGVRLAGEGMVARFKRGQFADGAIGMAQELARLTQAVVPPMRSAPQTAAIVKKDNSLEIWFWIMGGLIGIVAVISLVVWLVRRSDRLESERRERWAPQPTSTRATRPNQAEAQRVFDSYTPEQRRTIIEERHHHHYSSGAGTDPLLFWMLLNASQPHYAPSVIAYDPRHHTPTPSPSYDQPEQRRESSSDSYSSPNYDSGSSSSDSGSSSSDSSGGGGSW